MVLYALSQAYRLDQSGRYKGRMSWSGNPLIRIGSSPSGNPLIRFEVDRQFPIDQSADEYSVQFPL